MSIILLPYLIGVACYLCSLICIFLVVFSGIDIARDFKRMEDMGREMVKYCAGLPLAIVILGGILVTKPTLIDWEKVYNDSLSSLEKGKGFGKNQQEQLLNILARSYNDLRPQLKPCFLYLGKYRVDRCRRFISVMDR